MTALGSRFWRLYASSATSNLSDGLGRTALPLLAATLTRNPLLISGLATLAFLPWLLFALVAGALVDRVDRRRAMALANAVRAVALVVLGAAALTHHATIVLLYVVAFVVGSAETVYDCAVRAILPQVLSGPDDLDRANGLLTVEETLGQTFLGAPLGSALFAWAVAVPFLGNAAGFVVAAALVLSLRGDARPARQERTSLRTDVVQGLRWLRSHRLLRGLTLVSTGTSAIQSMSTGLLVLYVLQTLHVSDGHFGLVLLGPGVGGVLGGLVAGPLAARIGRVATLVAGSLIEAIAVLAMGLTHDPVLGTVMFGLSGFGVMLWNVLTMSLRQALIPQELFGRVQGSYRTLVWGAIPLGSLVGGFIASATSVPTVFVLSGVGLSATTVALWRLLDRHRDLLAPEPLPVG